MSGQLDLRPLLMSAFLVIASKDLRPGGFARLLRRAEAFGYREETILARRDRSLDHIGTMRGDERPWWSFDDIEVLPPGVLDPRALDQSEVWIDEFRTPHAIADRSDFTDRLLVRTWNMLDHRPYWDATRTPYPTMYAAIHPGWAEPPGWPTRSPLCVAINAELARRGLRDVPDDRCTADGPDIHGV
jgi:hypothetical protein